MIKFVGRKNTISDIKIIKDTCIFFLLNTESQSKLDMIGGVGNITFFLKLLSCRKSKHEANK